MRFLLFNPPDVVSPNQRLASYKTKCRTLFELLLSRENKGTERDSEGVGWDMSIPQKLFIDWLLNGSLFPETSASIPFPMFFEVVFIDKT